MQKKWKYAKPQKKFNFDEYLILPLDKNFKITIKNWTFSDSKVSGYGKIFRTDVIKLDGKDADKILVVKNYDNVKQLKKDLAKKTSIRSTADFEISRHHDEDNLEYYFKIKMIK